MIAHSQALAKEVGIYYDNDEQAYIVVVDNDEYVCTSLENAVRFAARYQVAGREIDCDSTVDATAVNTILRTIHQEQVQAEWSRKMHGYNRRVNGRFSHVDK